MCNDYIVDIRKNIVESIGEIITIILITLFIAINLILFSSDQFIVIPLKY